MDDLVGAAEIAERLHLAHRESVHVLRRRHPDFPAPVVTLKGAAMIWSWRDVEAWAKKRAQTAKERTPRV